MRNPRLIIATGTPGWTLLSTLRIFSRVRQLVPDASLAIFYEGDAPALNADDPQVVYSHRKMLADVEALSAGPRVTIHQRPATAEDFEQAAIWCFPSHLPPDSVPAAELAQRYGAIPFINPIGALAGDVFAGIAVQGMAALDRMVRLRYAFEISRVLTNEAMQEQMRVPMMERSREMENHAVAA